MEINDGRAHTLSSVPLTKFLDTVLQTVIKKESIRIWLTV